jgi:hypothetical protein
MMIGIWVTGAELRYIIRRGYLLNQSAGQAFRIINAVVHAKKVVLAAAI